MKNERERSGSRMKTMKTMKDVADAMRARQIRTFAQQSDALARGKEITAQERTARRIYIGYILDTPGDEIKRLP